MNMRKDAPEKVVFREGFRSRKIHRWECESMVGLKPPILMSIDNVMYEREVNRDSGGH